MPRIQPLDPAAVTDPRTQELFAAAKAKLGGVPNMLRTLGQSPAALAAYLGFSGAVAGGVLTAAVREQIALAVGQANGCDYCLSAHAALGKKAGLTDADVQAARHGTATDPTADALVRFARRVNEARGRVTDADVQAVRAAGATDAEIAEVVAAVALNVYTNWFNHVADPAIDFPKAAPLAA
jgi:uncharacterized peroxidase-related enzyme